MTNQNRRPENVGPADALPEWFNELTRPKNIQKYESERKRPPVSDTPVMVIAALAFSTGACLALLIVGLAI